MAPAALVDPRGQWVAVLLYIQSDPPAESLRALPPGQSTPARQAGALGDQPEQGRSAKEGGQPEGQPMAAGCRSDFPSGR